MKNSSIIRCKDQICLQINSTEINCLSIDENLISNQLITSDNNNLDLQNEIQSLVDDDNIASQIANSRKKHYSRPSNTILFCIIILGILVTVS
jgi:hypothetical protein